MQLDLIFIEKKTNCYTIILKYHVALQCKKNKWIKNLLQLHFSKKCLRKEETKGFWFVIFECCINRILWPCSAEPIHLPESSVPVNSCYNHQTCTKTTGCTSVIRIWKWAIYCRPLETNRQIKEALKHKLLRLVIRISHRCSSLITHRECFRMEFKRAEKRWIIREQKRTCRNLYWCAHLCCIHHHPVHLQDSMTAFVNIAITVLKR